MSDPLYRRVIVKLSGEALTGSRGFGIDQAMVERLAADLAAAAKLGVSMMTVHAAGGRAMMEAIARELGEKFGDRKPRVVAVTVLTSLDTRALFEMAWEQPVDQQVERLALLAQDSGIDGVVCSPREIQLVRKVVNPQFKIVTPGIRLPDQSHNDQQRVATPREALSSGADYIVLGRAVTGERDPRTALQRLLDTL